MADDKMADQAEQQKKGEVFYVDPESGETKSRKALDTDDDGDYEAPKPLGTDPAALGADGKAEFLTHKDAQKAEKDGKTL